jgi:putative holliday junction resolvase
VRALGLDVGSRTIGVAISDAAGVAAHPHKVIARQGTSADVAAVVAEIAVEGSRADGQESVPIEDAISVVVVGIPYELSGKEGPRARRVRVLVDALRAALPAGVELHEQDERFTTAEAERVLVSANVSRERRREVIDQQAAALILQGWLDARRRSL